MKHWWYWYKPRIPKQAVFVLAGMACGLLTGILWAIGVGR